MYTHITIYGGLSSRNLYANNSDTVNKEYSCAMSDKSITLYSFTLFAKMVCKYFNLCKYVKRKKVD